MANKPVRKPEATRGCESCFFKGGEFTKDTADPKVIRVYCKARFADVDGEIMSKDCDFWRISLDYERPNTELRYGL